MSELIEAQKSFRFYVDITKSEGNIDKDFYVEGYAATTDLDRQGDIIVQEALKEAAKDLVNINHTVFYNHEYDLQNAVGRIVDASVDDIGLKVRIYVSSLAKELRIKIKEGIITKFSIGGRVLKDSEISRNEAISRGLVTEDVPFERITIIEKLELFEVSFVGVPANPQAQVVGSFAKALEKALKGGGETVKDEKLKETIEEEKVEKTSEEVEKTEEKTENIEEKLEEKVEGSSEEKSEESEEKKEESKEEVKEESNEESKDEVSEEEIKDLIEDEKAEDEDKKPYYYYYYGRKVKDSLDKIGKDLAAIKEDIAAIKKDLKELSDYVKEKVKTIEVHTEKKTLIKKEDPIEKKPEKKELTEEDIDMEFFKFITRK